MTDQPIDILIPILREIQTALAELRTEQSKMHAEQSEMKAQIASLASGQVSIRAELRIIRDGLHEMAIAVDGHNVRLDRIEQHLGLDAAKH